MGSLVEKTIDMSITSLKEKNLELAQQVNTEDNKIDRMDVKIENECMNLIVLQQPIAKDLRTIAAALKIITDLERMGDNAVNIAKITMDIGMEPLFKPLVDIPQMSLVVQCMVKESLDAFLNEDIDMAKKVAEMDDKVDEYYRKIFDEILSYIYKDTGFILQGAKLLFVSRYLERIADHVTNICERIIYMVTGEFKEIN